jgi:hypothetical protein
MSVTARKLGRRQFTADDQLRFAELSGDRNPIHVDPVVARRLLTGQLVVHGIHVLLTGLEFWTRVATSPCSGIDCTFNNAVCVDETVDYWIESEGEGSTTISARVEGLVCATMSLRHADPRPESDRARNATNALPVADPVTLVRATDPRADSPASYIGKSYRLDRNPKSPQSAFPGCAGRFGARFLHTALDASYIVGMICPGLHSVFSSCDLPVIGSDDTPESLQFRVLRHDPRFRLVDIAFGDGATGRVRAFQRPDAQVQPTVADARAFVRSSEFAGSHALVIGGSRGLGESTAKLLAAGGSDVTITFAQGADDAAAVCKAINSELGDTRCRSVQLDLRAVAFDKLPVEWGSLTSVFFFSTPRIFRKRSSLYEPALLSEFVEFYVASMHRLCIFLEEFPRSSPLRVFVPSTVYIEQRPQGMTEYAMAKAAAEVLASEINSRFKNVEVRCRRLPRLPTDQTAAIIPLASGSVLETLAPIVRSVVVPVERH